MEEAAAQKKYAEIHEARPYHDGRFRRWGENATAATPYHYLDGVHIGVSETDLNPGDDFLTPVLPFGFETTSEG